MKYPKLYKQTSTGKVQEWEIWTEGNEIHELYGQRDGKKQHRIDVVKSGKNIGRANETTPEQQADFEANAKWTKKQSKDYREDIAEIAKARTTSSFGGFFPMLAHKYVQHKEKITFPCYVQPKLDGIRCISVCKDDKVTLWFRSGKPVKTMSHIQEALEKIMQDGEIWDGELYIHNNDFNKIGGNIRRDKHTDFEASKKVEYHIYDYPRIKNDVELLTEKDNYKERRVAFENRKIEYPLVNVLTEEIENEEEMLEEHVVYVTAGYEGIMLRNKNSAYVQKRSYDLLKYKEFEEDEFKIVGYEEGRGILQNAVGAFVCALSDGNTFNVKLKGKDVTELLKEYFKHPEVFMGKELTVQYQGMSKDNVPRFPVGKIVRFDK